VSQKRPPQPARGFERVVYSEIEHVGHMKRATSKKERDKQRVQALI
jgi:hypothetical protein